MKEVDMTLERWMAVRNDVADAHNVQGCSPSKTVSQAITLQEPKNLCVMPG